MAKKKTTDKRLTFKNEDCRYMEHLADLRGQSVKRMLEMVVTQWLNERRIN
jgi:hypothetical protein